MPFPVPGARVGIQSNMAATLNIDWVLELAEDLVKSLDLPCPPRDQMLALFNRKAREAEPGRLLYHPFISVNGERGPFVDPAARAQIIGIDGATGLFDLMRAVYEGLGFAARDCYAALDHRPAEIRLAGGATRSALCREILAAATGAPVRQVKREEAGAAGAAMVAAVAIGAGADIPSLCRGWVDARLDRLEAPDPGLAARYDRLYPAYRAAYRGMSEVWATMKTVRKENPLDV
jgi:erythritol kinase